MGSVNCQTNLHLPVWHVMGAVLHATKYVLYL